MARGFLTMARISRAGISAAAILATLVANPPRAQAQLACTGAAAGGTGLQLSDAQGSPLYALLKTRLGVPTACKIVDSDAGRELSVTFPQGGSLTYTANEAIESSAQEALVPSGGKVLTASQAIAQLRLVEKWAAAPKGCGIAWSKLAATAKSGKADASAAGATCNCRAHLKMEKGVVSGLGFSMAC